MCVCVFLRNRYLTIGQPHARAKAQIEAMRERIQEQKDAALARQEAELDDMEFVEVSPDQV